MKAIQRPNLLVEVCQLLSETLRQAPEIHARRFGIETPIPFAQCIRDSLLLENAQAPLQEYERKAIQANSSLLW